jgi:hypothetical protein
VISKWVLVGLAVLTAGAGDFNPIEINCNGVMRPASPSRHGTRIAAASGKVLFSFGLRGKTLKAIAYKAGLVNSLIAVGYYVYESPY